MSSFNSTMCPASNLIPCCSTSAGTLLRRFQNLNARVVSLPEPAIQALAAHSEIRYISLDKQIADVWSHHGYNGY